MTISYELGDALYINLTNRCNCACVFCIRNTDELFEDDLWLPREPSREEALEDILSRPLATYAEIVFCGFGEPTHRIDDIIWLCGKLREQVASLPPLRLNTNGHGSLIHNRDITTAFAGKLDRISISLNASNKEDYNRMTRPRDPEHSWEAMLDFAKRAKLVVPEVVFTIVDFQMSKEEKDACIALTQALGIDLRIRVYSD